ncbi:MAG: winged helix-turn-helix domain-containing protein [Dyella sp.]|uniref:winged helix-turn-helix domain-containing protein n=1 Tax=Dyella sp. TaxID=1869338 RepID=UPI003F822449
MKKIVYCFGDFRLDPLARELLRGGEPLILAASAFDCLVYLIEHRERPVGKDELVSAVWGRSDVSGNLVAQTIMRLRRQLADAGDGQHCIKTISRAGYRWLPDTIEHEVSDASTPVNPVAAEQENAAVGARGRFSRKNAAWLACLGIVLMALLVAGRVVWHSHRHEASLPMLRSGQTAIVLPAEVSAPQDWNWLRFGLMELVSQQLRADRIPTESSRTVLSLVDQSANATASPSSSFALVLAPKVTLAGGVWTVQLDAKGKDNGHWQVESSSTDVLTAAHAASVLLSMQWGMAKSSSALPNDLSLQEYLLRIDAAELAGHQELERELLDNAPPSLRKAPELALAEANFHCHMGEPEACEQRLTKLLQRLPADKQPLLRGKALTGFWYVYYRQRRFAEGDAVLDEAVSLLREQKDAGALATAYHARALLKTYEGKFDQAISDLGLAYVNAGLAGDTVGQVCVEQAMADVAMDRGQYRQALALAQRDYERLQRMGARKFLVLPLQGLIASQKALLQYAAELDATDRYWPFERTHLQVGDPYLRHALVIWRAVALADNGRTGEAAVLLKDLLPQLDEKEETVLVAWACSLLSQLALDREDVPAAQAWISKALVGDGLQELDQDTDSASYIEANLVNIHVLVRGGKLPQLKRAVVAMQSWVEHAPRRTAWMDIMLMRAKAAEAWSEGHRASAREQLKLAMDQAELLGVPELIVSVGQGYAIACLETGDTDQAMAIVGRLSTWNRLDWRVAWLEARIYRTLGQASAADSALRKAQQLAGDRVLPLDKVPPFF